MATAKFLDTYDIIEFSIEMEGGKKICGISREALEDHFGATKDTAVAVLLSNLNTIAPVAERVARSTPPGEQVLVESTHF
ncbi:hypothetical protein ACSFA8_04855 [Variovorax sp. RT4R15]|uniref:hypothetical protein n=1 Tax=Variovorax sp. RT4R15 TaxID=3443737 RepID=UPI003F457246